MGGGLLKGFVLRDALCMLRVGDMFHRGGVVVCLLSGEGRVGE